MSNICQHVHSFTGLRLIPGKHVAVLLRDGSRLVKIYCYNNVFFTLFFSILMFIFIFKISENDTIPLTRSDLKMNCNFEIEDNKEDCIRDPSMSSILVSLV